jgi:hypothetical protein
MGVDVSFLRSPYTEFRTFLVGENQSVVTARYAVPQAIAWMSGEASSPSIDRVYILLGTNDFARQVPIAKFTLAYKQLIDGIQSPVTCILPVVRKDENWKPIPLESYRVAISSLCSGNTVIDPREVFYTWDDYYFESNRDLNEQGVRALGDWIFRHEPF